MWSSDESNDTINLQPKPTPEVEMKVTSWVVMIHVPSMGTYAPQFPSIDEAEEFSNAMRVLTDDTAVSEPIPIVKTQTVKVDKIGNTLIPKDCFRVTKFGETMMT